MTEENDLSEILIFYNNYDKNKDGLISHQEFDKLIQALGARTSAEERRAGFDLIDTDNNGYIDFSELSEWWGNH